MVKNVTEWCLSSRAEICFDALRAHLCGRGKKKPNEMVVNLAFTLDFKRKLNQKLSYKESSLNKMEVW